MNKYSFAFFLLVIGLVLGCEQKEKNQKALSVEKEKKVELIDFSSHQEEIFQQFFDSLHRAGILNGNVLVSKKDSVYAASFGWKDFRSKDSLQLDHVFQLASVSKPLTAFGVMLLVQSGDVKLDEDVRTYLPDFPYKDITIRQLLAHRSGLSNYMYITDSAWVNQEIAMCNADAYAIFRDVNPTFYYPADKKFNYCNTNYFLLAYIVETVTHLPFEVYMAKAVFDPLEMNNTRIYTNMSYAEMPNVAVGSNAYGTPKADFYLNGVSGDKGVFSTVNDLNKFHRELVEGSLLAKKWIKKMMKPQSKFSKHGNSYGLGFRLKKMENKTLVYHKGWWRGYRSYFYHCPNEEAAIIVLTNTTKGKFLDFSTFWEKNQKLFAQ